MPGSRAYEVLSAVSQAPRTCYEVGESLKVAPAAVRRVMGLLEVAGYVVSAPGPRSLERGRPPAVWSATAKGLEWLTFSNRGM